MRGVDLGRDIELGRAPGRCRRPPAPRAPSRGEPARGLWACGCRSAAICASSVDSSLLEPARAPQDVGQRQPEQRILGIGFDRVARATARRPQGRRADRHAGSAASRKSSTLRFLSGARALRSRRARRAVPTPRTAGRALPGAFAPPTHRSLRSPPLRAGLGRGGGLRTPGRRRRGGALDRRACPLTTDGSTTPGPPPHAGSRRASRRSAPALRANPRRRARRPRGSRRSRARRRRAVPPRGARPAPRARRPPLRHRRWRAHAPALPTSATSSGRRPCSSSSSASRVTDAVATSSPASSRNSSWNVSIARPTSSSRSEYRHAASRLSSRARRRDKRQARRAQQQFHEICEAPLFAQPRAELVDRPARRRFRTPSRKRCPFARRPQRPRAGSGKPRARAPDRDPWRRRPRSRDPSRPPRRTRSAPAADRRAGPRSTSPSRR